MEYLCFHFLPIYKGEGKNSNSDSLDRVDSRNDLSNDGDFEIIEIKDSDNSRTLKEEFPLEIPKEIPKNFVVESEPILKNPPIDKHDDEMNFHIDHLFTLDRDYLLLDPEFFRPPIVNMDNLPIETNENIELHEDNLSKDILEPLNDLLGERFDIFVNYVEVVKEKEAIERKETLCEDIMSHIRNLVNGCVQCLRDLENACKVMDVDEDFEFYRKCFLNAVHRRTISFRFGEESGPVFEDGTLIAQVKILPKKNWWDFIIKYESECLQNETLKFGNCKLMMAIEKAVKMDVLLASQLYYTKYAAKNWFSQVKKLKRLTKVQWRYDFDLSKIWSDYDKYLKEYDHLHYISKTYMLERNHVKIKLVRTFEEIVKRIEELISIEGKIDENLLSSFLKTVPTRKIEISYNYVHLDREKGIRKPNYSFEIKEGKLILEMNYFHYVVDGILKNPIEEHGLMMKIHVNGIPFSSYKDYLQKGRVKESELKNRLKEVLGSEWNFKFKFKMIYEKLKRLEDKRIKTSQIITSIPSKTFQFFEACVKRIEEFVKIDESSSSKKVSNDDPIDSDEEEEEDDNNSFPAELQFSAKEIINETFPTRTVSCKFLTRIKEKKDFCWIEEKKGQILIKVVKWNTIPRNLGLDDKKDVGFSRLLRTKSGIPYLCKKNYIKTRSNDVMIKSVQEINKLTKVQWKCVFDIGKNYAKLVENKEKDPYRCAEVMAKFYLPKVAEGVRNFVKKSRNRKRLVKGCSKREIVFHYDPDVEEIRKFCFLEVGEGCLNVVIRKWFTNIHFNFEKI